MEADWRGLTEPTAAEKEQAGKAAEVLKAPVSPHVRRPNDTRNPWQRFTDALTGRTWRKDWHRHVYAGEQCFNCGDREIEYTLSGHKICRKCFKAVRRINADSGAKQKQHAARPQQEF